MSTVPSSLGVLVVSALFPTKSGLFPIVGVVGRAGGVGERVSQALEILLQLFPRRLI